MMTMHASLSALCAMALAKVVIVPPVIKGVRVALHKTFKPFPIIPDRWGELLDRLD